jgi:hypothetical protein
MLGDTDRTVKARLMNITLKFFWLAVITCSFLALVITEVRLTRESDIRRHFQQTCKGLQELAVEDSKPAAQDAAALLYDYFSGTIESLRIVEVLSIIILCIAIAGFVFQVFWQKKTLPLIQNERLGSKTA